MEKYRVYRNLHNGKFSIKNEAGLVVGHADSVRLFNVSPVVSEAGRNRVLKEKRKNVHAYMRGCIVDCQGFTPYKGRNFKGFTPLWFITDLNNRVSYNPYVAGHFVKVNGQKFTGSYCAEVTSRGIFTE